jgi:hypothetical protein
MRSVGSQNFAWRSRITSLKEFPRAPAVTMTRALKRTDAPHVAEILVDVFTQQKALNSCRPPSGIQPPTTNLWAPGSMAGRLIFRNDSSHRLFYNMRRV